jgi:hypothetical protein
MQSIMLGKFMVQIGATVSASAALYYPALERITAAKMGRA